MPRSAQHPSEFIDLWTDELASAFEFAEKKYRLSLDRGAPREHAIRTALAQFLPRRIGVTAGHVVSSKPEWSRQSDVILYNALEAPVFSKDDGHQGDVLPVESVYGIIEVKSTLDEKQFKDAADKVAAFKRLCSSVAVGAHTLSDRFGAVVAFRCPEQNDTESWLARYSDLARSYPPSEQVDDVLIVGTRTAGEISGAGLVSRLPQGGPSGPLDHTAYPVGRKSLPVFLLRLLDERLKLIRTGAPDSHVDYLLKEVKYRSGPDPAAQRNIGETPLSGELRQALKRQATKLTCPGCGKQTFRCLQDAYYLVTAKDFHFGRLGAPYLPMGLIQCEQCGHIMLFSTKALGITPLS